MATATHTLQIIVKIMDKATQPMKKATKQVERFGMAADKASMKYFGLGMGLLFTGMAIKQFAEKAMGSIWTTYKQTIDVHDEFFQKTQQLSAAWEFFKFSLIDALGQSELFLGLIDFVIGLINWFGQLSPSTKRWIIILLGGLAVLGTAMMLFGQVMLFVIGVQMAGGFKKVALQALVVVGIIAIIATATIALVALWNSNLPKGMKVWLTLGIIIFSIVGILALVGLGSIALWVLMVGAVVLIIAAFVLMWDEIVTGAKNVWAYMKWFGRGLEIVFKTAIESAMLWFDKWRLKAELVGDAIKLAIASAMEWAVNKAIDGLNWLIQKVEDFVQNVLSKLTITVGFGSFKKTIHLASALGDFNLGDLEKVDLTGGFESQYEKTQAELNAVLEKISNLPDKLQHELDESYFDLIDELLAIEREYQDKKATKEAEDKTKDKEETKEATKQGLYEGFLSLLPDLKQSTADGTSEGNQESTDILKQIADLIGMGNDKQEEQLNVDKDANDKLQSLADKFDATNIFGSSVTG